MTFDFQFGPSVAVWTHREPVLRASFMHEDFWDDELAKAEDWELLNRREEFAYDDVCESLSDLMSALQPRPHFWSWLAEVHNFGWLGQDGYAEFSAHDGRELLRQTLPKRTTCYFRVFSHVDHTGRHIKIQNFHHDSPVGKEWYTIYPAIEQACGECGEDYVFSPADDKGLCEFCEAEYSGIRRGQR